MKGRGDARVAASDRVDDILRLEEDPNVEEVAPIKPMRCPRCGKKVIFKTDGRIVCEDCGELYYDCWLGIWRILPIEVHED